jgi:hypothetical protein
MTTHRTDLLARRVLHIATFVSFLVSGSFAPLFFHQLLSKIYCLTLLVTLTSFEPFRLAARNQSEEARTDVFARNIHLEVIQDTDCYMLRTQDPKDAENTSTYNDNHSDQATTTTKQTKPIILEKSVSQINPQLSPT